MRPLAFVLFWLVVAGNAFPRFTPNTLNDYPYPTCFGPPLPVSIRPPYSQSLQNAFTNLSDTITSIMKQYGTVSISANLVVGNDIIWSQGFGVKNLSDPQSGAPNGSTIYRIGSISKVLTVFQLLQLRDQGIVTLDDPLTKYIPQFSIQNPYSSSRYITLRQLAGHAGGLPRSAPCNETLPGDCSETNILSRLTSQLVISPIGTRASYSNLGFTLLGRSLEAVTPGSDWENSITQNILTPLKMANTYPAYSPAILSNMAVGYDPAPIPAPLVDLEWQRPAGEMYSTVDDLAKLLSFIFNYDQSGSNSVLDPETLREWFEVTVWNVNVGISHPWETYPWGNYTLYTKSGSIYGYTAWTAFIPELKVGYNILQSDSTNALSDLVPVFADFLVNVLEPEIWSLQTPPLYPGDINQFPGTYVGEIYGGQYRFQIVFQPFGALKYSTLLLYGYPGISVIRLDWLDNNDSFMMSFREIAYPCQQLYGGPLEVVYFHRDTNGNIISFDVPGTQYGMIFYKQ